MRHFTISMCVLLTCLFGVSLLSGAVNAQTECNLVRNSFISVGDLVLNSEYDSWIDILYEAPIGSSLQDLSIPGLRESEYPVRVFGERECTNDILWWEVETQSGVQGWMPEIVGTLRVLAPVRNSNANFLTSVYLTEPAPIVDQALQLGFSGGAGDTFCSDWPHREVYQYGQFGFVRSSVFQSPTDVTVTILRPDGTIYNEGEVPQSSCDSSSGVGINMVFTPQDPTGAWTIVFEGEHGITDNVEVVVAARSLPWLEVSNDVLFLDGFESNETVDIRLAELGTANLEDMRSGGIDTEIVHSWQLEVDEKGQLQVEFDPQIVRTCLRFLIIEDSYGNTWGNNMWNPYDESTFAFHSNSLHTMFGYCSNGDGWLKRVPPVIDMGVVGSAVYGVPRYNLAMMAGSSADIRAEYLFEFDPFNFNLDPIARLYAPDGTLLAENDNASDPSTVRSPLDAYLANILIPEDGIYVLEVDQNGSQTGSVKITVGVH